jgi:hypothetical protein
MKIAINGDIIDTQDIYMITEIKLERDGVNYSNLLLVFRIKLWNNKEVIVKRLFTPSSDTNRKIMLKSITKLNDLKDTTEYKDSYLIFSNFRDEIINVWSNNQPTIQQFNLDDGYN